MKETQTLCEAELLGEWLGRLAQQRPRLKELGSVQQEQLAPGPGWALQLTGCRTAAGWQDVEGRTHQVRENDYTLRVCLPVPDVLAAETARLLTGFAEDVNLAGQVTDPPPIGESPFLLMGSRITRVPGDGDLWEYRLGLAARHMLTIEP